MRTTRRASLFSICIAILIAVGACSAGGGSPVTPDDNNQDFSNYASTLEGYVYQGSSPAGSGHVYIYDLESYELYNEADVGSDGFYKVGFDEGQYLVFAFNSTGWSQPQLEGDFSNYVNVEPDLEYRLDYDLASKLVEGEELVFGFVKSTANDLPVASATVSAGGNSTITDAYGFYAMAVPAGTGQFTITAEGFFDLEENIREGQATDDYFDTPFFNLNPMNTTGASIGGTVRDVYDGEGLGGVRVKLWMPSNPNFTPVRFLTNLGGTYRFFNLPEGIYRLYFERPGYVSGSRDELVVTADDDVIINVFMHPDATTSASIDGYVNAAGVPLPINGARITASNPLLGSYIAFTNPTGYYNMGNLVPANYSITVVAPGEGVTYYEAANTFHTIVAGSNRIDFALRFLNEGVLRGDVSIDGVGGGAFAFPPTGVEVTAEKVGGANSGVKWRTNTNGEGIFVFNGIPEGIYKVTGRAEYTTFEVYTGTMYNIGVTAGVTTNLDLVLTMN